MGNVHCEVTRQQSLVSPRRLYARFDEWSRNLSRLLYAVLVGVTSGLTFLGGSAVFGDTMIAGAVAFGATMVVLSTYSIRINPDKYENRCCTRPLDAARGYCQSVDKAHLGVVTRFSVSVRPLLTGAG